MEKSKRAQFLIQIESQAPLAVGDRKLVGRSTEALRFIPGGLIRGALAELILHLDRKLRQKSYGDQEHRSECLDEYDNPIECDFCDLFLREVTAAIFRNAYPVQDNHSSPYVLPATARSCKDHSGFNSGYSRHERDKHGVFDTLIDRLCSEELGCIIPYAPTCPACGSRTESIQGIYSTEEVDRNTKRYHAQSVPHRLLTRVAINRRRLTAEDELLYSLSVLSEPAFFKATIDIPASLAESVKQMLERITHIGGGISRGLGKVKITVYDAKFDTFDDLRNRVEKFNQHLAERWTFFGKLPHESTRSIKSPGDTGWTYFTIDLQSDSIICDETSWRPTMVLSGNCLQRESKCRAPVELVRSYASYTYRSGWNAVCGLPKDVNVATTLGSVFVYRTPTAYLDTWIEAWLELERCGIGSRRAEGFGQVKICDEFHLVLRDEPV